LSSLLAWHKDSSEAKSVSILNDSIDVHLKMVEEKEPGHAYLVAYNPDFVLEVVREYMQHIGTEPLQSSDPPNPLLNRAIRLLQHLTAIVPGM
jgi:hypothetical protein